MEYQQLFIVGDAILQEMRFKMETPLFFLNYWKFEKFYTVTKQDILENEVKSDISPVVISNKDNSNLNLKEVMIKGNCQITLW